MCQGVYDQWFPRQAVIETMHCQIMINRAQWEIFMEILFKIYIFQLRNNGGWGSVEKFVSLLKKTALFNRPFWYKKSKTDVQAKCNHSSLYIRKLSEKLA